MNNSLHNILEIFDGSIIRIPAFQRGYSWEEKQLSDLWKDIMNLEVNFDTKYHFTGVLVFEELDELSPAWKEEMKVNSLDSLKRKPYSLIDGQQRITSVIILIYVLLQEIHPHTLETKMNIYDKDELLSRIIRIKNVDGNRYLFGYEIDTPSHQFLINRIFEDDSVELLEPETVYTQNLETAKLYFQEQIAELSGETHYRLLYIMLNQLKFSKLILRSSEIDISMVFETLNFRGKPLSHLELLKNRLLYLLSRNGHRLQNVDSLKKKIVETWLTIYEYLGKIDKKWINENEFLKSYWLIFFNHEDRVKGQFNDYVSSIFDDIFPIQSEENEYLSHKNLKKFLANLELAIKAMFYIHNPDQISIDKCQDFDQIVKISSDESIALLSKLNEMRTGWLASKNIICAYIINDSYDEVATLIILRLLERHNFLTYNLFGRKSDTNRVYLYRLTNKIFRNGNHDECKATINLLTDRETNNYISIINFVHSSKSHNKRFYDWIGIDYLLREYERFLLSNGDYSYYENLSKYRKLLVYNPEIRNFGFNDFPSGQIRFNFAYSLGNLVLSPSSRKTTDFNTMQTDFVSKGTKSEKEMITNKYNGNFIYNRGVKMLKFVEKRWLTNLPFQSENEIKKILFDAIPKVKMKVPAGNIE